MISLSHRRRVLLAGASVIWIFSMSCTMIHYTAPPESTRGTYLPGSIVYQIHDPGRTISLSEFNRYDLFVKAVDRALRASGYADPVLITEDDPVEQQNTRLKLMIDARPLSIFYDYRHAAAPQEWLTGLTFGAIPSWATRHQMKMTFELFDGGVSVKRWEYMPEVLWVNHLILFPISFYQIITLGSNEEQMASQLAVATRYFMGGPR